MRVRRGQSIIEYTIIIGIVAVVLSFMGTGIKRGFQSLVKVTADQVGNQQNADQQFDDYRQGYMQNSITSSQQNNTKQILDKFYVTNIVVNENSDTITNTSTNGGFSPDQTGQ